MLALGFRRSGDLVYRPHCAHCRACVAIRIPVASFKPNRSQRRCIAGNCEVTMRIVAAQRTEENFALYRRYLAARHPDSDMQAHGPVEFDRFLIGSWPNARFMELREQCKGRSSRLLAVAVTDVVPHALSAVYTFYDPEAASRGLGTLAILYQIAWAQQQSLAHLYLGYWIQGHPKMDYKQHFRPFDRFDRERWHPSA
jgi:arginine-tRNA-protein transferase